MGCPTNKRTKDNNGVMVNEPSKKSPFRIKKIWDGIKAINIIMMPLTANVRVALGINSNANTISAIPDNRLISLAQSAKYGGIIGI